MLLVTLCIVPAILRIKSVEFAYPIEDIDTNQHGFNLMYKPGEMTERKLFAIN